MSDPGRGDSTEPPMQVLYLLESGYFCDAAAAWTQLGGISLPAASMLCLRWVDNRAKASRRPR